MRVWEFDVDIIRYKSYNQKNYGDIESELFDGRILQDSWKIVEFVPTKDEKGQKREFGDVSSWLSVPLFQGEAIDKLKPLIGDSIEILPINVAEKDYKIINVIKVLDCIDYDNAEVKRLPSGGVLRFLKYAFQKDVVENEHIFRIKEKPGSRLFVSDDFKKVVEENNLTGFKFELVWDSEEQ